MSVRSSSDNGARRFGAVAAAVALAAILGGCATARLESEWKSPEHAARSLKGQSVLVMCAASDESLRRICEDQWSTRFDARGVKAVRGYQVAGLPSAGQANPDEINRAAKRSGAAAVASTRVGPTGYATAGSGSSVGVGVGGAGGSGGGISFGGIGISFPIGGAGAPVPVLGASTTLVDVASNALMWSGNATAPGSESVPDKVASLTQVLIEALQKAGML
jgi:hypothetical protein